VADAPADPAGYLSGMRRRELASMPYTAPEVLLQHVGPLWRAFQAVEAERDELAAQLAAVRAELDDALRDAKASHGTIAAIVLAQGGSVAVPDNIVQSVDIGTVVTTWYDPAKHSTRIAARLAASPSTPEETP
jgi:hypothetical protein